AAVLRAAAGFGVDERAHVGRGAEALGARLPGTLDECLDLGVVLDPGQLPGLVARDQGRHGRRTLPTAAANRRPRERRPRPPRGGRRSPARSIRPRRSASTLSGPVSPTST